MAKIFTTSPAEVMLRGLTVSVVNPEDHELNVHSSPMLISAITALYSGKTTKFSNSDEFERFVEDIKKTKLQTPLEFINTVWLFQNVTRGFTHQLVRYRVGTAFVQESLRFVAKRELNVFMNGDTLDAEDLAGAQKALDEVEKQYNLMIRNDVPIQDARAILPTNVLTNIWASISLRSLANIYTQRMCCQAQEGEWNVVLGQMKDLLTKADPILGSFLQPPTPGRCGFGASFDRPCKFALNGQEPNGTQK